MFVSTPTPDLRASHRVEALFANTVWRGAMATLICTFAIGCATSTPLINTTAATLDSAPTPIANTDSELPPKAKLLLANANELLEHLSSGTADSLKAAMSPDADAVNEKVFRVTSDTIKRLGAIKNKSVEGFQNKDGIYTGQFEVQFENMNAELSIATKNDKILAWELGGEEMDQQLSYTFFDSFKKLTLITSSLEDANGEQHEAVFSNGEKLQITLMIAGFERRTNFAHVRLNMHLKNARGELLRTVNVVDNSLKMKNNEPPAITLSTWLALTEPGTYIVELEIQDVYSDNSLVHAQDIQIKGQAGSSLSKVFMAAQ